MFKASKVRVFNFYRSVLFCVILLLLTTCYDEQNNTASTTITSQTVVINQPSVVTTSASPTYPKDWNSRWLRGIPCSPPCFEGIIPNITSPAEFEKLLAQNPLIKEVNGTNWKWSDELNKDLLASDFINLAEIKGINKTELSKTSFGGKIIFDGRPIPGKLSSAIIPDLEPFKLAEVFKAYGEPDSIIVGATQRQDYSRTTAITGDVFYPYFATFFLYLKKGFALKAREINETPQLTLDMTIDRVYFFAPEISIKDLSLYIRHLVFEYYSTRQWEGFDKGWKYYCYVSTDNKPKPCS